MVRAARGLAGAWRLIVLRVEIDKRLGDFHLTASFASEGGATALFGPSGSGKTSIVNMIAGLVRPDRGRIALHDDVLFDSAQGIDVPAHKRRIGYVFQEGRLFPHRRCARTSTTAAGCSAWRPTRRNGRALSRCWTSAISSTAARRISPAANASASRSGARC
jgi:ABC-type sulfate/molybdate transport systems ATPase subunit